MPYVVGAGMGVELPSQPRSSETSRSYGASREFAMCGVWGDLTHVRFACVAFSHMHFKKNDLNL